MRCVIAADNFSCLCNQNYIIKVKRAKNCLLWKKKCVKLSQFMKKRSCFFSHWPVNNRLQLSPSQDSTIVICWALKWKKEKDVKLTPLSIIVIILLYRVLLLLSKSLLSITPHCIINKWGASMAQGISVIIVLPGQSGPTTERSEMMEIDSGENMFSDQKWARNFSVLFTS